MRTFSFDGEQITVPEARLAPVGGRPLVSIVLTAYRRARQLKKTLQSLRFQSYWNTEIIVVEADDDGGETLAVCREFGRVKYLRRLNKADRRTAVTNNIGIRNSSGEIIVLQCAEMRHESSDTIDSLIRPIIADPSVSTFPMVVDLDERGFERGWKFHPATHPNCFITFCQAFSRQAVERIGGFDEEFVGWGLEDNDFNFRLQYSGVRCVNVNAIVAHQWHEPPRADERTTKAEYYAARHAEILSGASSFVANRGVNWGMATS